MASVALTAAARPAWSSTTVCQFGRAVLVAAAALAVGCLGYAVETGLLRSPRRFIENPSDVMMRALGLAHFLIGWLFLCTSPRLRRPTALARCAGWTALGVILCVLLARCGGLRNPLLLLLFYTYFLIHEVRDQARLFLAYGDAPGEPAAAGRFLERLSMAVALLLTAVFVSVYSWHGSAVVKARTLVTCAGSLAPRPDRCLIVRRIDFSWPGAARPWAGVGQGRGVAAVAPAAVAGLQRHSRHPGDWRGAGVGRLQPHHPGPRHDLAGICVSSVGPTTARGTAVLVAMAAVHAARFRDAAPGRGTGGPGADGVASPLLGTGGVVLRVVCPLQFRLLERPAHQHGVLAAFNRPVDVSRTAVRPNVNRCSDRAQFGLTTRPTNSTEPVRFSRIRNRNG